MDSATVTRECGHKERISLRNAVGGAGISAALFDGQFGLCRKCKKERGNCPRCGEKLLDPCDPNFCEACFQEFGR